MRKFLLAAALCSFGHFWSFAQADSLMSLLGDDTKSKKKEDVNFTFKATRIINGSTTESLGAGVLDMRIEHRFGLLGDGAQNSFGFDNAQTRIGLDYGITKYLMVGLGHSAFNRTNDFFGKVKLLRQQTIGMPISLSYYTSMAIVGGAAPTVPAGDSYHFSNRMSYSHQLLIARKFNDRISLQLVPTLIHINLIDSSKYSNNTLALGVGGRIKLSNRMALTAEYFYRLNNTDMPVSGLKTYNSLAIGLDIETGGHVFQLMFTNSQGVIEKTVIGQTTDSWSKPDIHFGFNISRVFTVVKPKEFRGGGSEKKW